MKSIIGAVALIAIAGKAYAQGGWTGAPSDRIAQHQLWVERAAESAAPDFGYVVYDEVGHPIKAFGPDAPVEMGPDGKLFIQGNELPAGAEIRTEDGITYLNTFAALAAAQDQQAPGEYAQRFNEMLASINNGASAIITHLCPNPARPSRVQVSFSGGFSFWVHGSLTSTVDWDLEEICKESKTAGQSSSRR